MVEKNEKKDETPEFGGLIGSNLLQGISFEGAKGFQWNEGKTTKVDDPTKVVDDPLAVEPAPADGTVDTTVQDEDDDENVDADADADDKGDEGNQGTGQEGQQQDESPIKIFAGILVGKGLAEQFKEEEFEDNDEFLTKLYEQKLSKDLQAEVENYKNSIPEEFKELFENYEEGVPLHELLKHEARISEYSTIKVEDIKENEALQKRVVKADLLNQGFSEEKADKKIERYEAAGTLSDEAEDSLDNVVKYENKAKEEYVKQEKAQRLAEQKGYTDWLTGLNKTIQGKTEIIPGVKITDDQKKKLYEAVTKPVDRHPQTKQPITAFQKKQMEDPEFLIKVAYLANVLNWDFGALERSLTTKVVKKVTKTATTYNEQPSRMKGVDMSILKKIARS